MPTLYIIRGLPGSGKSTIARRLVHESRHREADMFHLVEGEYAFDITRVKEAHQWCLEQIVDLMASFPVDCAVSNTFTMRWEYQPYIDAGNAAGYDVMIVECHGPWQNKHNVPEDTLQSMINRWQPHRVTK